MKVIPSFRRIARKAGGLHLGIRLGFPASLFDYVPPGGKTEEQYYLLPWQIPGCEFQQWTESVLTVGLIAWEFRLTFQWGFH